MGVSKAILESVILCHQEESNWPLSEPSALKKKFDDIFEASRFTKALDHIKTLRKERVSELKVDQERLNFLKQDKEKAERLKGEIDQHARSLAAKRVEEARLDEEVKRVTQDNNTFYNSSTQFMKIFDQAERLQSEKKMQKENMSALQKHITLLKGQSAWST